MEKMQLGSPASPGITGYLPNFLMGVDNHQTPSSFCKFYFGAFSEIELMICNF